MAKDTITVEQEGRTFEIPVVFAFDQQGQPVDLVGDIIPEACSHKGATWSSNLDMRCPHCGSRLFLPPRFLACKPEAEIEEMYSLWERAGWPEFIGGKEAHWSILPEYWTVIEHPLFAAVGGLAVRKDRLDSFSVRSPEPAAEGLWA